MDVYRINNIALASGMGVDPSLISRWRSGARVPGARSAVPEEIAAHLAGLGMLAHDRETLAKLLGNPGESRAALSEAIAKYLRYGEAAQTPALTPESPELVDDMFARLGRIFSPEARMPTEPVSLFRLSKKGRAASHETFDGIDGIRDAILALLHDAIALRSKDDICFLAPPDDAWIDDADFRKLFLNAVRQAVAAGHGFYMIHSEAGGAKLPLLLSAYMPLYATGHFFSYGRDAAPAPDSPGIFAVRGHGAAMIFGSRGAILHRAEEDARLCCDIIDTHLSRSKQLAAACVREAPLKFAERLIQLEDAPGALFEVKNTPDAVFLPERLAFKLLSAQMPAHLVDIRLDMIARRREALLFQAETEPWLILLPTAVADAMLLNGACRLSGIELLSPRDVTLEGDDLRAYLENLLSLAERYPLLNIAFADDCPSTNITVKENQGAFFIADTVDSQPSAIYVGDKALCDALARWFLARARDDSGTLRAKSLETLKEALDLL